MPNLDTFAKDYEALHASYEKQAYLIFKRALDKQTRIVADYAKANGVQMTSVVLAALIDTDTMKEAYIEAYTAIGTRHARNYSRYLDKTINSYGRKGLNISGRRYSNIENKAIGFSSEFWRRIMVSFFQTEAAGKVTEVNETTKENIRKILAAAQEQNLTVTQQADYLRKQLNDARFNATRAMLIARTESTAGANRAAAEVGQQADFVLVKGWLAALDGRTRNSHRVVGQREPIAIDALFEVPNPKTGAIEYARHPGDSTLSAANCVNCRCSIYHLPKLDSDGLPIAK